MDGAIWPESLFYQKTTGLSDNPTCMLYVAPTLETYSTPTEDKSEETLESH